MVVRVFNLLAMLTTLLYQIPSTPLPEDCVDGTKDCWSVQELFGLYKYEGVARTPAGLAACNATLNFNAGSPFATSYFDGVLDTILLFVALLVQSAIFDHPGHTAVRRQYASEARAARIRRRHANRLNRVMRSRKWVSSSR